MLDIMIDETMFSYLDQILYRFLLRQVRSLQYSEVQHNKMARTKVFNGEYARFHRRTAKNVLSLSRSPENF